MSSITSLLQTAKCGITSLHNAGNVLKSEIELDRQRGQDVSKKEEQLDELKTKESEAYGYFTFATEITVKQTQAIIDSVPKETDETDEKDKADETNKTDETDKTCDTNKTEGTDDTDGQSGGTEIIGETEVNTDSPDRKSTSESSGNSNCSNTTPLQQTGQVVDITV